MEYDTTGDHVVLLELHLYYGCLMIMQMQEIGLLKLNAVSKPFMLLQKRSLLSTTRLEIALDNKNQWSRTHTMDCLCLC